MSRNILSIKEIYEIYNNFVAINYTEEYTHRYANLPLEKNNKNWKWEGKDFPRVVAVLEFEKFITENSLSFDKALCITGMDDPEYEYVTCKEKVSVQQPHPHPYPGHVIRSISFTYSLQAGGIKGRWIYFCTVY